MGKTREITIQQSILLELAIMVAQRVASATPQMQQQVHRRLQHATFDSSRWRPNDVRVGVKYTGWPSTVQLEVTFRADGLCVMFTGAVSPQRSEHPTKSKVSGVAKIDPKFGEITLIDFELEGNGSPVTAVPTPASA